MKNIHKDNHTDKKYMPSWLKFALKKLGLTIHTLRYETTDITHCGEYVKPLVDCTITQASSKDKQQLFYEAPPTHKALIRYSIKKGNTCYVAKNRNNEIICSLWEDVDYIQINDTKIKDLKATEAYLYGAYTQPAYRNKRLFQAMKRFSHKELQKQGKTVSYGLIENKNIRSLKVVQHFNCSLRKMIIITLPLFKPIIIRK